jgi:hypothetical protein
VTTNNITPEEEGKAETTPWYYLPNFFMVLSFLLISFGFYPLRLFMAGLGDLHYQEYGAAWAQLSALILSGIVIAALNIRDKNHQPAKHRVVFISLVGYGFIMCLVPALASVIYGAGIGN